jgi:hypothetical protein
MSKGNFNIIASFITTIAIVVVVVIIIIPSMKGDGYLL